MVEMEKPLLKRLCRDMDLYVTPSINDKLIPVLTRILRHAITQGFRAIKNLDEYTGLKVLWLEGNGLGKIEGLEHQALLRTLFLHENLISKIEGLEAQVLLDTLNLSQNQITKIENLSHMKALTSLALKSNYLVTADDIAHVLELPSLSVLDIQSNRIADVNVVDILAQMPELKVLYLQGNDVVKHIKQYRKTLVFRCRKLKYLDDRPVFDDERRRVEAWGRALEASNGDYNAAQDAEREEMEAIRREKKERDELNFLHFEQMMIDGRRKRKEEEEAERLKKQRAAESNPEHESEGEVSRFSGEKILPVQDCELIQRERENRWAAVVNAGVSDGGVTEATDAPAQRANSNQEDEQANASADAGEGEASAITVDARRLELLHQCATVGSGAHSSRDPFVASSFAAESAEEAERRQRIKDKASAKVEELKAKKAALAELIPAATRLITCDSSVLLKEGTYEQVNAAADSQPLMPPPAPAHLSQRAASAATAASEAKHTDVDELD